MTKLPANVKKTIKSLQALGFQFYDGNKMTSEVRHINPKDGEEMAAFDYYMGMWVNPKIQEIADKNGVTVEWIHPGALGFYD